MENGARWILVQKLQSELSGYMAGVYSESEEAVPRQLKKKPYAALSGSTIETFRSKLKSLACIDSSKMAAFRKKNESGGGGKLRPVMPEFGAMKLGELNKFALENYGMSGFKRQQIAVTNVTKCWVEAQKKTEAEEEGQQQPPPKRRKVLAKA
jgi:hypothetical protein